MLYMMSEKDFLEILLPATNLPPQLKTYLGRLYWNNVLKLDLICILAVRIADALNWKINRIIGNSII